MKKQQLIILIFACLIAAGAAWLMRRQQQKAWEQETPSQQKARLFPDLPINKIRRIKVTASGSVELTKKDAQWVVAGLFGYPADYGKVANLVKSVYLLKAVQMVPATSAADLARLELNPPDGEEEGAGTLVEFFADGDNPAASMLLGKQHMSNPPADSPYGGRGWPDGRYLMLPKTKSVALVTETFRDLDDEASSWLDTTFLKVEKITQITGTEGDEALWVLTREGDAGDFKLLGDLAEDEELNTSTINTSSGKLSYPRFDRIGDPAKSDEDWGFTPGRGYRAETSKGVTYSLLIGKKLEDGKFPLRVNLAYAEPEPPPPPKDETEEQKKTREEDYQKALAETKKAFKEESRRYQGWTYIVPSDLAQGLMPARADLVKMKEKKEEPKDDGSDQTTEPVDKVPTTIDRNIEPPPKAKPAPKAKPTPKAKTPPKAKASAGK